MGKPSGILPTSCAQLAVEPSEVEKAYLENVKSVQRKIGGKKKPWAGFVVEMLQKPGSVLLFVKNTGGWQHVEKPLILALEKKAYFDAISSDLA